jgi:hypothetical protein
MQDKHKQITSILLIIALFSNALVSVVDLKLSQINNDILNNYAKMLNESITVSSAIEKVLGHALVIISSQIVQLNSYLKDNKTEFYESINNINDQLAALDSETEKNRAGYRAMISNISQLNDGNANLRNQGNMYKNIRLILNGITLSLLIFAFIFSIIPSKNNDENILNEIKNDTKNLNEFIKKLEDSKNLEDGNKELDTYSMQIYS